MTSANRSPENLNWNHLTKFSLGRGVHCKRLLVGARTKHRTSPQKHNTIKRKQMSYIPTCCQLLNKNNLTVKGSEFTRSDGHERGARCLI